LDLIAAKEKLEIELIIIPNYCDRSSLGFDCYIEFFGVKRTRQAETVNLPPPA